MKRRSLALPILALLAASGAWAEPPVVAWIRIDGTINPATANYIERALAEGGQAGAACLVIELDTPGGLLDSTKSIVQAFYTAPVPVVVYVAPSGAVAGSAGCFITLAAHIAAMAPNTSIGAAHPVVMGGGEAEEAGETMNQKLENFAASFMESIAEKRQRNAEWAISAVRESSSITAEDALEKGVIDLIAADLPDLLRQLDGRGADGRTLATAGADVVEIPMLLRERVFQMIWRPEVMFILMLVAIYGIIGELSSPGMVMPGVVGVIALILVLYMAAILPVNVAGMALMALAVGLFIAEAFTPTFGILTTGGALAFFLGALLLFDRGPQGFHIPLAYIIPGTLLTAAFFAFVVGAGLRAQRLPVRVGRETLIGRTAVALSPVNPQGGHVALEGEDWAATSDTPVEPGHAVEVIGRTGLRLFVKPKPEEDSS